MKVLTISFPRRKAFTRLLFIVAVIVLSALDATPQRRAGADPYQKISLKTTRPCAVGVTSEVTSLVRNGVELSVNEDWDCDGVADAYDNCVGMPNRDQIDADGSGIGDTCEAAANVRAGRAKKVVNSRRENRRTRADRKTKVETPKPDRKGTRASARRKRRR